MGSAARRLTWKEFLRLPADDLRHELVRGELRMTPPPGFHHGTLVAQIAALIHAFVRPRRLGWVAVEPAVKLAPDTCLGPDVAFLAAPRGGLRRQTHLQGPPDLAVEVLSPSTGRFDRAGKLSLYREHGVREYWIVDSAHRTIEVHDFVRGRRRSTRRPFKSAVLPGLMVDPAEVFSVLDG